MTIETATYTPQLDATYPASGDAKSEGDNHIRLLKSTIKATWPNLTATAVTPTSADLNTLAGASTTGGVGVNVVTQTSTDNSTKAASTAFVSTAVAAAAFSTLLPSQSGNAGRNIWTNGATASWESVGGPITSISGTTQTAVSGPQYVATNVAATTLTLPSAPSLGDVIWFTVGNNLRTNVIDPGAKSINGVSGSLTVDDPYATIFLKWDGSTWRLVPLGGYVPSFSNPTINGGTIGATTPGSGAFTTLSSTGNAALGDAEASDTHAIKGATTLLANSASAALTVTQTGAGNAFVVEDSASADSTPFVIDASGNVSIGAASSGGNKLLVTGNVSISANLGIGAGVYSDTGVRIGGTIGTATTLNGIYVDHVIPATTTVAFYGATTAVTTAASAFTLGTLSHFRSYQGSIGAGSSVTTQYGFEATSTLTGATNNYGFYGNIPAGANRYNFYAAGTAQNYFAGNTGIGIVPTTTSKLTLAAGTTAVSSINIPHGAAPTSPVNGDMWTTTAGLFIRINGVTKTVTLT